MRRLEIVIASNKPIPNEVLIGYYERALRWENCARIEVREEKPHNDGGEEIREFLGTLFDEGRSIVFVIGVIGHWDGSYTFHS